MSGYRANCGFGQLTRTSTDKVGELPSRYTVLTQLSALNHRYGAGIELSINRNRNNNYLQDIGYREFTTATSGMYDIDFTISGAFVPEMSSWLEYLMMSDPVLIKSNTTFVNASGTVISNPTDTTQGYAKNGTAISKSPIVYQDFNYYKTKATAVGSTMNYVVYSYINMDGPKYFDMGYQLINENTTYGGLNELGVLVGCVIDSVSINYESGSDAQVKFTINGIALNEYIYTTSTFFDYNSVLDYEVPLQPLVAGCVSVLKDNTYETIAQTDSAGISINNNVSKLGNCLKLTYSSIALGSLGIEMNISTYANDPNKFMAHMYGYDSMGNGSQYEIAKQPYAISKMKIRSDNTSSTVTTPTQALDLNLTDVYVGSANRTYNVDNAIMDEPDLRPRKVQIVVGYKS